MPYAGAIMRSVGLLASGLDFAALASLLDASSAAPPSSSTGRRRVWPRRRTSVDGCWDPHASVEGDRWAAIHWCAATRWANSAHRHYPREQHAEPRSCPQRSRCAGATRRFAPQNWHSDASRLACLAQRWQTTNALTTCRRWVLVDPRRQARHPHLACRSAGAVHRHHGLRPARARGRDRQRAQHDDAEAERQSTWRGHRRHRVRSTEHARVAPK